MRRLILAAKLRYVGSVAALVSLAAAQAAATTVIDVPPDTAPSSITGDTVLNLNAGGVLPANFTVFTGGTVNIAGGSVGDNFSCNGTGTLVTVTGGIMGDGFYPAISILSGGSFGQKVVTQATLIGADFEANGVPISGLNQIGDTVPVGPPTSTNYVLSGTFADGTPFAFAEQNQDLLSNSTLQLSAVPPPGPALINLPGDVAPAGVRGGQTLNVAAGGVLQDNFNAGAGSTVNMTGGTVGRNFEAIENHVNISGGVVGPAFDAFLGSTVNLQGGNIGDNFLAAANSTVNASGARVGAHFDVANSSNVTISGGTFGLNFTQEQGSNLTVVGTDFRINGVPLGGLSHVGDTVKETLQGVTLTGVLADGTPIFFGGGDGSSFATSSVVTFQLSAPPVAGPAVINTPSDTVPLGIRGSQVLNVLPGGAVGDNFNAAQGTTVNISGGTIGNKFEIAGALLNASGGTVGDNFSALLTSTVNVNGAAFGNNTYIGTGATLNLTSGSLGNNSFAARGSTVNMSGGTIGSTFSMFAASVTITDGSIGDGASAQSLFGILQIKGGNIGSGFGVTNATVDISGGSIGNNLSLGFQTIATMSGGSVGTSAAFSGTTFNFSGGSIGDQFRVSDTLNGSMNMSGGTIGHNFDLQPNSTLNLSGGSIAAAFQFEFFSTANILGSDFLLNGQPIAGLVHAGDSLVLSQRGGAVLTGMLADGTPFDFVLNATGNSSVDVISQFATLRLTVAPEPSSLMLAAVAFQGLAVVARRRVRRELAPHVVPPRGMMWP